MYLFLTCAPQSASLSRGTSALGSPALSSPAPFAPARSAAAPLLPSSSPPPSLPPPRAEANTEKQEISGDYSKVATNDVKHPLEILTVQGHVFRSLVLSDQKSDTKDVQRALSIN